MWGAETKGGTEQKAAGAHLAILGVDVLAVPLHYRSIDEQAPHDDNHFQHLPQGHLSKHTHVNVNAHTCESHAVHETVKGDVLGTLSGKTGACPVGWPPECSGANSQQTTSSPLTTERRYGPPIHLTTLDLRIVWLINSQDEFHLFTISWTE